MRIMHKIIPLLNLWNFVKTKYRKGTECAAVLDPEMTVEKKGERVHWCVCTFFRTKRVTVSLLGMILSD